MPTNYGEKTLARQAKVANGGTESTPIKIGGHPYLSILFDSMTTADDVALGIEGSTDGTSFAEILADDDTGGASTITVNVQSDKWVSLTSQKVALALAPFNVIKFTGFSAEDAERTLTILAASEA